MKRKANVSSSDLRIRHAQNAGRAFQAKTPHVRFSLPSLRLEPWPRAQDASSEFWFSVVNQDSLVSGHALVLFDKRADKKDYAPVLFQLPNSTTGRFLEVKSECRLNFMRWMAVGAEFVDWKQFAHSKQVMCQLQQDRECWRFWVERLEDATFLLSPNTLPFDYMEKWRRVCALFDITVLKALEIDLYSMVNSQFLWIYMNDIYIWRCQDVIPSWTNKDLVIQELLSSNVPLRVKHMAAELLLKEDLHDLCTDDNGNDLDVDAVDMTDEEFVQRFASSKWTRTIFAKNPHLAAIFYTESLDVKNDADAKWMHDTLAAFIAADTSSTEPILPDALGEKPGIKRAWNTFVCEKKRVARLDLASINKAAVRSMWMSFVKTKSVSNMMVIWDAVSKPFANKAEEYIRHMGVSGTTSLSFETILARVSRQLNHGVDSKDSALLNVGLLLPLRTHPSTRPVSHLACTKLDLRLAITNLALLKSTDVMDYVPLCLEQWTSCPGLCVLLMNSPTINQEFLLSILYTKPVRTCAVCADAISETRIKHMACLWIYKSLVVRPDEPSPLAHLLREAALLAMTKEQ